MFQTGLDHGGPDALGVPALDLSTNANACGPYAPAVAALRAADARHYPDPAYTALTVQLAAWHGVAPARVVLAASGSEFIQRISVAVGLQAGVGVGVGEPGLAQARPAVWLPAHAYGDYARAAHAAGLARTDEPARAALIWACEPSSPLGQAQPQLMRTVTDVRPAQALLLDQAYEPLRLSGAPSLHGDALHRVWRLITPNKALGLTGVRAAYAIAPERADAALLARVRALAPSWPLGAHGVALLQAWATMAAHDWLRDCRATLTDWKASQTAMLRAQGWHIEPSDANFFVAAPAYGSSGVGLFDMQTWLAALRTHGIKLRDGAGFGLPGRVRVAVTAPPSQALLAQALARVARGFAAAQGRPPAAP